MKNIRRIGFIALSIVLGLTFLYSAWTKASSFQSLEKFEWTMVEFAHLPWLLSAFAARFFIGMEAALGTLILLHFYGRRKWVLKTALALLVLLSAYLIYLWITQGNNVNCGCFGDEIQMTASESLIKNALLILALLVLIKYHTGIRARILGIINPLLFLIIVILPFILYGFPDTKPDWKGKDKFQPDLSALYKPDLAKPIPTVELKKGKHILSFLSLSCPHCRMAAKKMHIMKQRDPSLPIYMVLAGKDKYWKSFWEDTKATNIPYTKLDADAFLDIAGNAWPVIWWMNNGWVEAQSNYIQLDQHEVEKWLVK
jgi:hypothetical protein